MRKDKIKNLFSGRNGVIAISGIVLILLLCVATSLWRSDQKNQNNGEGTKNIEAEVSKVYHWTGKAGDGKWSTAGNWDINEVPNKVAQVIFSSGTGEKSKVDQDFKGEIQSLRIEGYTGKITQNKNLKITGNYFQDAGEYEAMGGLEVGGDFIQKNESIFTVFIGDTKIAGGFEIGDKFKIHSINGGAVYLKDDDIWKMLTLNEQGVKGYYANKETTSETETWNFYNATNGLISYISQEKGWTLSNTSNNWEWRYLFKGVEREGREIYKAEISGISANNTKVSMNRGMGVEEWYDNTFRGIEQGFTIQEKPEGEGELTLSGEVKLKSLTLQKSTENALTFAFNDIVTLEYGKLFVVDAAGKKIEAKLTFDKIAEDLYNLKISVDDSAAKYPIVIDPISTTPVWTGRIDSPGAGFGKVATPAGDVNGDGRSDFLVTAEFYTNGQTNEGKAYLYYGSDTGIATSPAWSYESNYAFAYFGHSASAAGDVNNDGYDDIVIGASGYDTHKGKLYVFLGGVGGLSVTPDWTYTGDQLNQDLGQSLSDAGDVNGDGFDDIIAGAHYYDLNAPTIVNSGKVFLFKGSATGLSAAPTWTFSGTEYNELLGFSVSSAADVNKDGYSDILIGSPRNGATDAGIAYLFLGSSSGLPATPSRSFQIATSDAYFGNPVAAGGDINKDGYPDILIGASRYDGVQSDKGAVFAYYGSATGFPSAPSWQYIGEELSGAFLGSAWSTAGDVNGDGYDDAVAGSCGYNAFEGRAFVFLGSISGLAATPVWTKTGGLTNSYMGWYADTAGDVNGDGASDFLVSSYQYDNAVTGGRAYLFSGATTATAIPEICTGGIDEDKDGLIDMADPDCDSTVNKSTINVNVSTVDQNDWFSDIANMDSNADGIKDRKNPAFVGPEPMDADLSYYQICDSVLSSYTSATSKTSYITAPYIRDVDYAPCDRDKVDDDYHSTDSSSPTFVQPAEKKFTIRATASDPFGIQSIRIEWFNANSVNPNGQDWSQGYTSSKTCTSTTSCTICVKGGDCGAGNDVIDYASLGIPDGKKQQRLFFRIVVTDNSGNVTATGYDNDTAHTPVLDKYYRFVICSKDCHTCTNTAPIVTLNMVEDPANFCNGLDYTLHWNFQDAEGNGQSSYELQVREKGNPAAPILSTVRESGATYARLFTGVLSGGDITYGKTYEWRVRAYDDSTEEGCKAVSNWTAWSPAAPLTFQTPSRYPTPSFQMTTISSSEGSCGVCGFYENIMFKSDSTVYVGGITNYDWYIDGTQTSSGLLDTIFTSFTNEAQPQHNIRLVVRDGAGHSCEITRQLNLTKGSPVWNEVAPVQD